MLGLCPSSEDLFTCEHVEGLKVIDASLGGTIGTSKVMLIHNICTLVSGFDYL